VLRGRSTPVATSCQQRASEYEAFAAVSVQGELVVAGRGISLPSMCMTWCWRCGRPTCQRYRRGWLKSRLGASGTFTNASHAVKTERLSTMRSQRRTVLSVPLLRPNIVGIAAARPPTTSPAGAACRPHHCRQTNFWMRREVGDRRRSRSHRRRQHLRQELPVPAPRNGNPKPGMRRCRSRRPPCHPSLPSRSEGKVPVFVNFWMRLLAGVGTKTFPLPSTATTEGIVELPQRCQSCSTW